VLTLSTFEMLTGRNITPLPVTSGSWSMVTNADESITCSVPARDPSVRRLRVWEATTLARNGLLAEVDGMPVAAGPIWKRKYDADAGTINLTAGGLRSYWNRRVLVPVDAIGTPLIDPVTGDPNPALNIDITGASYGTIAKKWVELVRLWPGGNIPMTFPADEVGTRTKPVAAIDLKMLGKLIADLSNLERGPDFAFRPRRSLDGLGIYWEMQHGSEANPRLGSTDAANTRWVVGGRAGGAFGLVVDEDGTGINSAAWVSGGGSSDRVIIARAESDVLAAEGFPRLDTVDAGHSDIKLEATAQSYANQHVALGRYAASFWSMKVRAREKGSPRLGDYWLGDMATVTVHRDELVLPPGDRVRRIAAIKGDLADAAYDLTFAEAIA
jgi:hypothetical protein